MSPRAYTIGQRQLATDLTRGRIVAAARDLLADEKGSAGFTLDAVARKANVARMTVYYQFDSKRGLLEALFDDLANRGLMPHLRAIFHEPDPKRALNTLIAAFVAFWEADRVVLRRVRALAALDADVAASVRAREEIRRGHLSKIVGRLYEGKGSTMAKALPVAVDVLHMLTTFETFDALRSAERSAEDTRRIIGQLAAAVIESPPKAPASTPRSGSSTYER
jgi:AcrR family transcriptional regulator